MSEDASSQVTTEEPKVDETIVTAEGAEGASKGPQPIYKADESEEESPAGEPSEEDKPSEKEEPEAGEDKKIKTEEKEGETKEYNSLEKPEDSLLSDSDMERILSQAKEEGLSKEDAQKQVELADSVLKTNAESVAERHNELSEKWVQECKEDKEIGGEKFDESVSHAQRALKKFGTEKLMESLNETRFGNNPEVLRVFARIGKAMSPDDLILPGVESEKKRSYEDVFYGDNNNN